jgi:hypothetical protein
MSLPRLDALESDLLQELRLALLSGRPVIRGRDIDTFLEERKCAHLAVAIVSRLVKRGYLQMVAIPPAPVLTGPPIAGSIAAAEIIAWNVRHGPRSENYVITADVLDDATAEQSVPGNLDAVPLAAKRAYSAYCEAVDLAAREGITLKTDEDAYDFIAEHVTDYKLPKAFETFTKHLRVARKALGTQKRNRRKLFKPSRSIVKPEPEYEPEFR